MEEYGKSQPMVMQAHSANNWDNADTTCLAFGPDGPYHIFAGCAGYSRNGALWVTDPASVDPLNSWSNIPLPDSFRGINRILVLRRSRRVVVAAQGGVWWSPISAPMGYDW